MSRLSSQGIWRRPPDASTAKVSSTPGRPVLVYVFGALVFLTGARGGKRAVRGRGPVDDCYQTWFHDLIIGAAAVLILARAVYEPTTRTAWLAFGLAMAFWSVGSISWSLAYSGSLAVPYPTFADVLWLLWYPLMAVGITLLIKVHLPRFELHRWMDGLAVTLLVLAAGFALIIQPVAERATQATLATVVDFSYPVLDVLLMGALLGVYGLLGWRPDRMWTLIGLGVLATTIGDARSPSRRRVGWWTADVTTSSGPWGRCVSPVRPGSQDPAPGDDRAVVTGMRAVILLLVAQAIAAGIQIYALFGELARSERVVTLAVLVVTSVQIFLNRPRPDEPTRPQSVPRGRRSGTERARAGSDEPVHDARPGMNRCRAGERDGPAAGSLSTGDETREAELT